MGRRLPARLVMLVQVQWRSAGHEHEHEVYSVIIIQSAAACARILVPRYYPPLPSH